MGDRGIRYERALRWYPAAWRRQHGPALIGDLMEQDDERGRSTPSVADRFAIARHGVLVRYFRRAAPGSLQVVALILSVLFMTFYESLIALSLERTPPGGIGPFSNGLIVPAVLLFIALVLALARRACTARLFAWVALLSTVAVAVLAATFHWQGPSAATAVLVVLLCLASAAPVVRRGATSAAVALSIVLLAVMTIADPIVNNLSPTDYATNPLVGLGLLLTGLLGAAVIAVAAWRLSPTT